MPWTQQPTPSLRWTGPVGLALALLLVALGGAGWGLPLQPLRLGGVVAFGYGRTTVEIPQEELDPADHNPTYDLVTEYDGQLLLEIWGVWKTRALGRSTRFKLSYQRRQWMESVILSRDELELQIRHKLGGGHRLETTLWYAPQVYLRHRADKDAQPGEPKFRPQAYEGLKVGVEYTRTWSRSWETHVELRWDMRDETRWFNERDRWRTGIGAGLTWEPRVGLELSPAYAFRVARSRNEPDLGSDYSYREHVLELNLRLPGDALGLPLELRGRGRLKLRHYTTTNPDDRRYGREDRLLTWRLRLRRAHGTVRPFLQVEGSGYRADFLDILDDDQEFQRATYWVGLEWERE
jgi:hypothetical protein